MTKIPVQKGSIELNTPKTSKMMTHPEKVVERSKEFKDMREGQTLKMHQPKSGRK